MYWRIRAVYCPCWAWHDDLAFTINKYYDNWLWRLVFWWKEGTVISGSVIAERWKHPKSWNPGLQVARSVLNTPTKKVWLEHIRWWRTPKNGWEKRANASQTGGVVPVNYITFIDLYATPLSFETRKYEHECDPVFGHSSEQLRRFRNCAPINRPHGLEMCNIKRPLSCLLGICRPWVDVTNKSVRAVGR